MVSWVSSHNRYIFLYKKSPEIFQGTFLYCFMPWPGLLTSHNGIILYRGPTASFLSVPTGRHRVSGQTAIRLPVGENTMPGK